eukprot:GHRR01011151.1.p4 GENE.GHRR01011151.1~~GHRR01011151.1.p4  ORF type:complete len:104 (-),score=21.45 GHRR01011151.1:594-905(-)
MLHPVHHAHLLNRMQPARRHYVLQHKVILHEQRCNSGQCICSAVNWADSATLAASHAYCCRLHIAASDICLLLQSLLSMSGSSSGTWMAKALVILLQALTMHS